MSVTELRDNITRAIISSVNILVVEFTTSSEPLQRIIMEVYYWNRKGHLSNIAYSNKTMLW